MKEKIKQFWSERAKTTEVPRSESQVNFEKDAKLADLRVESETQLINTELQLNKKDTIVDLGAGNGRWSLLFSPKVYKVIAVEYIQDFADEIKIQARKRAIENVEVINSSAEDFCSNDCANVVFVSGLLNYLDSEQYHKVLDNMSKTLKPGGILFMRETISVLENEFIINKFSEELETHYCSIYRTSKQHIDALTERQFSLEKYAPFFEDGDVLNKRLETRLYYFVFKNERL